MAIVLLDTQTASFKTREALNYGPFIHTRDRAYMYFLEVVAANATLDGAYFNVNTSFVVGTTNIRSPLICKFFPGESRMGFLVKVPRIRDTNTQVVTIQVSPKEFFRKSDTTPEVDVALWWEDDTEYRLEDSFP